MTRFRVASARFISRVTRFILKSSVIIALSILLLEIALRLCHPFLPETLNARLSHIPITQAGWIFEAYPFEGRTSVNTSGTILNAYRQGDLFYYTCLTELPAESESAAASGHEWAFDEFGFRIQDFPLTGQPDVVTIGDSFGAYTLAERLWWRHLTPQTRDLSIGGVGTIEQYLILREFVQRANKHPQVIVLQYFAGNDMFNNLRFHREAPEAVAASQPSPAYQPKFYETLYSYHTLQWIIERLFGEDGILAPAAVHAQEVLNEFSLYIDRPLATDKPYFINDLIMVEGWTIDPRGGYGMGPSVSTVRLYHGTQCEGEPLAQVEAHDFVSRSDVADYFALDVSYRQSGYRLQTRFSTPGEQTLTVCATSAIDGTVISRTTTILQEVSCPYPITDAYDNSIAFYRYYVGMATLDANTIRNSESYQLTRDTIIQIKALADSVGAELVLLYIPINLEVHLAGLTDEMLYTMGHYLIALKDDESAGFIEDSSVPAPEVVRRIRSNVSDQRQLVHDIAIENNIWFLDVTSTFQLETQAGRMVYFPQDTHLNQHGNDIVNQLLRSFLVDNGLLPATALDNSPP